MTGQMACAYVERNLPSVWLEASTERHGRGPRTLTGQTWPPYARMSLSCGADCTHVAVSD